MRVLVNHMINDDMGDAFAAMNVSYRTDLEDEGPDALRRILVIERPDVLITRTALDECSARAWCTATSRRPLVVIFTASEVEGQPWLNELGIIGGVIPANTANNRHLTALTMAERLWIEGFTTRERKRRSTRDRATSGRSVTLVGAGIVNVITGLLLTRQGYALTVLDRSPDPRSAGPWAAHGCTGGGDNARMFTLTEADGYSNEHYVPLGRTTAPFDLPISGGGWRICDPRTLSSAETSWLEQYSGIPRWLARAYTEDILFFNRRAGELWEKMIQDDPLLFESAGIRKGILRLYSDYQNFSAQVCRQDRLGALQRVLTPEEVGLRHPALRDACANGVIAGGIEVLGFTVQVHSFVNRLLDLLEESGASLRWNSPVSGIHWAENGVPDGLVVADDIMSSDYYVISPGAYGHALLRGTASAGLIHGVLGVWMRTPNTEPRLEHSLKIARRGHYTEDANVTVVNERSGNPSLIFGSGYGWTGTNPDNIVSSELETMYHAVEDTIRRFFPHMYESARESGLLETSRRFCVRPWTPSSLGIFEITQTKDNGLLIVTGGHNTGGFAQAPVIAEAVLAALRGQPHPMHHLYQPQRLRRCRE